MSFVCLEGMTVPNGGVQDYESNRISRKNQEVLVDQKTILVGINDLFFYTKVRDALRSQGYRLEKVRAQEDFMGKASAAYPVAVLLDMNDRVIDPFLAVETFKRNSRFKNIPILAFASHEDVETWTRARALGVEKMVTRNEMSARARELVEELVGSGEKG